MSATGNTTQRERATAATRARVVDLLCNFAEKYPGNSSEALLTELATLDQNDLFIKKLNTFKDLRAPAAQFLETVQSLLAESYTTSTTRLSSQAFHTEFTIYLVNSLQYKSSNILHAHNLIAKHLAKEGPLSKKQDYLCNSFSECLNKVKFKMNGSTITAAEDTSVFASLKKRFEEILGADKFNAYLDNKHAGNMQQFVISVLSVAERTISVRDVTSTGHFTAATRNQTIQEISIDSQQIKDAVAEIDVTLVEVDAAEAAVTAHRAASAITPAANLEEEDDEYYDALESLTPNANLDAKKTHDDAPRPGK